MEREGETAAGAHQREHDEAETGSVVRLFAEAQRAQRAYEEGRGQGPEAAILAWERCHDRLQAHRTAFFSRNECLDDISTPTLKLPPPPPVAFLLR